MDDGENVGANMNAELKKGMKDACEEAGYSSFPAKTYKPQVEVIIKKTTGIRDPVLAPIVIVEILVGQLVERHRDPCLRLLLRIKEMLLQSVASAAEKTLGAYPELKVSVDTSMSANFQDDLRLFRKWWWTM